MKKKARGKNQENKDCPGALPSITTKSSSQRQQVAILGILRDSTGRYHSYLKKFGTLN